MKIALRRMLKQPTFAASVITSLGLAIGASAIAFSILDAVRLRALPLPESERLVILSEVATDPDGSIRRSAGCQNGCSVSYVTYSQALSHREFRSISAMAAFASGGKALTVGNDTQTVIGTVASPSLRCSAFSLQLAVSLRLMRTGSVRRRSLCSAMACGHRNSVRTPRLSGVSCSSAIRATPSSASCLPDSISSWDRSSGFLKHRHWIPAPGPLSPASP